MSEENIETPDELTPTDVEESSKSALDKASHEDLKAEIRKLRNEAKSYRLDSKAARQLQVEAEAKLKAEMDDRLNAFSQAEKSRNVRIEAKALAKNEGILDIELIQMIDLTQVKFSPDGEPLNVKEVIQNFKATKPHLFKQTDTSAPVSFPSESNVGLGPVSDADLSALFAKAGVRF